MQTYLVGGAVRDQLLNLPCKDRDWVVVGATPAELIKQGFIQVGADFPVFLHPDTHEEYALARTERKQGQGYQGFVCAFDPSVSLEEDLARRDLTINAMAQSQDGRLIDPYGGQADLSQKILRHVSPAFSEDPLRVLRVARFAARFAHLGFRIAPQTLALMQQMVGAGEVAHLVAERVWTETRRALCETSPSVYFQVLRQCGALAVWFTELDALFGVPQRAELHPEIDSGEHALLCLEAAHQANRSLAVRWAALIHDLGKARTPKAQLPSHPNHDVAGIEPINRLQARLKTPNDCAELALLSAEFHIQAHCARDLSAQALLNLFNRLDVWRKAERFEAFLQVCEADSRGRLGFADFDYPPANFLRQALQEIQRVSAQDMIRQGHQGAAIKDALEHARIQRLTAWRPSARTD